MVKEYITYARKWINKGIWQDPSYETNTQWNNIVFLTETSFGNTENDKRFLATIEYDENFDKIDRYINNYSSYSFTRITPAKALELCIEWYGEDMFELDVDGFTLIDKRPVPEVLED